MGAVYLLVETIAGSRPPCLMANMSSLTSFFESMQVRGKFS